MVVLYPELDINCKLHDTNKVNIQQNRILISVSESIERQSDKHYNLLSSTTSIIHTTMMLASHR